MNVHPPPQADKSAVAAAPPADAIEHLVPPDFLAFIGIENPSYPQNQPAISPWTQAGVDFQKGCLQHFPR